MSFEKIKACIETMEPEDAASAIGRVMQDLFPLLIDEARLVFVMGLVGEPAAPQGGQHGSFLTGRMHGRRCRLNEDVAEPDR